MRCRTPLYSSRVVVVLSIISEWIVYLEKRNQRNAPTRCVVEARTLADWRPELGVDQWKPSSLFSGGAWLRSHIIDSALEQAILGSHSLTPTKYHHHVIPIRWWWDQSTANEPTHTPRRGITFNYYRGFNNKLL